MKSFTEWSCLVVPERLRSIVYESLPEGDCPDKDFPQGFFLTTHQEIGI